MAGSNHVRMSVSIQADSVFADTKRALVGADRTASNMTADWQVLHTVLEPTLQGWKKKANNERQLVFRICRLFFVTIGRIMTRSEAGKKFPSLSPLLPIDYSCTRQYRLDESIVETESEHNFLFPPLFWSLIVPWNKQKNFFRIKDVCFTLDFQCLSIKCNVSECNESLRLFHFEGRMHAVRYLPFR